MIGWTHFRQKRKYLCFDHPIFLYFGFWYIGHFSCVIFFPVFWSSPSCLAKCKQRLSNIFVFLIFRRQKWPKNKIQKWEERKIVNLVLHPVKSSGSCFVLMLKNLLTVSWKPWVWWWNSRAFTFSQKHQHHFSSDFLQHWWLKITSGPDGDRLHKEIDNCDNQWKKNWNHWICHN